MKHERVYIESPYAETEQGTVDDNINYARQCMQDCFRRGEWPFAAHLLYTQPRVLDDDDSKERKLGMNAGRQWAMKADRIVVYTDLGVTRGMRWGINWAEEFGKEVEHRSLSDEENPK